MWWCWCSHSESPGQAFQNLHHKDSNMWDGTSVSLSSRPPLDPSLAVSLEGSLPYFLFLQTDKTHTHTHIFGLQILARVCVPLTRAKLNANVPFKRERAAAHPTFVVCHSVVFTDVHMEKWGLHCPGEQHTPFTPSAEGVETMLTTAQTVRDQKNKRRGKWGKESLSRCLLTSQFNRGDENERCCSSPPAILPFILSLFPASLAPSWLSRCDDEHFLSVHLLHLAIQGVW